MNKCILKEILEIHSLFYRKNDLKNEQIDEEKLKYKLLRTNTTEIFVIRSDIQISIGQYQVIEKK